MKKVVLLTFMFMMMWNVKSYAGRGGLCCCCDCEEEYASVSRAHLIEDFGTKWIADYEDFKQHFTADGHCEIRPPYAGSIIEIKEDVKAGRGQKTVVFEGLDVWLQRVRPDISLDVQFRGERGTVIRKGSIIDCERARIYHPDGRPSYLQKY